ncbi:hypothetical protein Q3G72_012051 [Acer saccharum]|nr:hypothetical protein Q3G72_012051 [Acer saccharum]
MVQFELLRREAEKTFSSAASLPSQKIESQPLKTMKILGIRHVLSRSSPQHLALACLGSDQINRERKKETLIYEVRPVYCAVLTGQH